MGLTSTIGHVSACHNTTLDVEQENPYFYVYILCFEIKKCFKIAY